VCHNCVIGFQGKGCRELRHRDRVSLAAGVAVPVKQAQRLVTGNRHDGGVVNALLVRLRGASVVQGRRVVLEESADHLLVPSRCDRCFKNLIAPPGLFGPSIDLRPGTTFPKLITESRNILRIDFRHKFGQGRLVVLPVR